MIKRMPPLRTLAMMGKWLGPWSDESEAPEANRCSIMLPAEDEYGPLQAWLYTPKDGRIHGAYIIAPGLHFRGPADPRMDRFAKILAAAGHLVLSPFVPSHLALMLHPSAVTHFQRFFKALITHPLCPTHIRPGVFSVSFGSRLALRLASSPRWRDEVGALIVFGGYADWKETVRFCATGKVHGVRAGNQDPLNTPILMLQLIHDLVGEEDATTLSAAWMHFMKSTWGRPEMKTEQRHHAAAEHIAETLAPGLRGLFLLGCDAAPGATDLIEGWLKGCGDRMDFLDARPFMKNIRCPVHLVHGSNDDVIHSTQLHLLAGALPLEIEHHEHLTGLYSHTSHASESLLATLSESGTQFQILKSLIRAGCMTR